MSTDLANLKQKRGDLQVEALVILERIEALQPVQRWRSFKRRKLRKRFAALADAFDVVQGKLEDVHKQMNELTESAPL